MDKGIVEGSEDAGDAEDEFTCACQSWLEWSRERCSPSLTWGPREMFSVAARSTFFLGGILFVV